jgi:hypothetical protein
MTSARLSIARGGQLDGMPIGSGLEMAVQRDSALLVVEVAVYIRARWERWQSELFGRNAQDDDGDGRLETFDALFPQNRYYGATSLIGASSNSLHGSPRLDGYFGEVVRPSGFAEFFWRESIADALYAPARFSVPPGPSRAHFVGSQYGVERELSLSRQLALNTMGHAAMIGPRRTALQPDTTQRHSRCTLQQAGASVTGFPRLDRARTGTPRG